MNQAESFLQTLIPQGIRVWSQDGKLRYAGPRQRITPQLLNQLKVHKSELLRYFSEPTYAPLSYGQRGLWFIHQNAPNNAAYNVSMAFRIHSALDISALHSAIQLLVNRHAALRTRFVMQDEGVVQQIDGYQAAAIETVDVFEWSDEMLREQVNVFHNQPFDLAQGPLFRAMIWNHEDQSHSIALSMHHIVVDGWSSYQLVDELFMLYAALDHGQAAQFSPLNYTYSDYVCWQQRLLETDGERLWAYWHSQLNGELPILDLPVDYPRPSQQSLNGISQEITISTALTQQLKRAARENGCTLYVVLLAAYLVLLHRYSGQDEIIVGLPMAGRSKPEFAEIIGYFTSPVVVRADLGDNPSIAHFLSQIKTQVLAALDHQDYPFTLLVEQLNPQRDPSHAPIYQTSFVLQKSQRGQGLAFQEGKDEKSGLSIEPIPIKLFDGQDDLGLELMETAGGIVGRISGDSALWTTVTLARMAGHFQVLLTGIVAENSTSQSITELPLLSDKERHQLLFEWNDAATEYPKGNSIHQLFEEQAERTPVAIAVIIDGEAASFASRQAGSRSSNGDLRSKSLQPYNPATLTYSELNERANQLAHYLQSKGVQPGAEIMVGVYMERSPEVVIALLAILKAGGVYVPLDPASPSDRLTIILEDAGIAMLLTHDPLRKHLQGQNLPNIETVYVDTEWITLSGLPTTNPAMATQPSDFAYMIYTSGSTGQPKGVLIEHDALMAHCADIQSEYALNPTDKVLQFSSLQFDSSIEEIVAPLLQGAAVVLYTADLSVEAFSQTICQHGVTVLAMTPAYWQMLIRLWTEFPDLIADHVIRLFSIGGDVMAVDAVRAWQITPTREARLLNAYGPTEATITATWFDVPPHWERESQIVPIGRPWPSRLVYILDQQLQPVPIGVPGELCIGGMGLARGYHNRPELTNEKFVQNPFGQGRIYRTGDMARFLPDGHIEFLGRTDQQVKIRGFRVELGEIEAILTGHPQVQEAVVLVHGDGSATDKNLLAYVAADPAFGLTPATLRDFLVEKLPTYMLPTDYHFMDALPLTVTGKVDRRALAKLLLPMAKQESHFEPPQTAKEQTLADIWRNALKVERVGRHDNFFTLGGDSILSLLVVTRIRQMGFQITPQQIFQYQSVAELAAVIETGEQMGPEPLDTTGEVPLSPIQRFWTALDLPAPNQYPQFMALELIANVDIEQLHQALQQVAAHHDALRLRFNRGDNGWQQAYADDPGIVPLRVLDATGLSEQEWQNSFYEEAQRIAGELNLQAGPTLGLTLFMRGSDKNPVLLWIIHHLAVDSVSWRILLEDLDCAYQQLQRHESIQLPAKTTSYKKWATWLNEEGPSLVANELAYWIGRYEGIDPFPVDHSLGEPTWESMQVVSATLDPEQTTVLLQKAPSIFDVQINALLLSPLLITCKEWAGEQPLLIELVGHGRGPYPQLADNSSSLVAIDLSRTVGWFTASFPVRMELPAGEWQTIISSVQWQLDQVPDNGIGYSILRWIAQDPTLVNKPSTHLNFNYLGQFDLKISHRMPDKIEETELQTLVECGYVGREELSLDYDTMTIFNGAAVYWNAMDVAVAVVEGRMRIYWLFSTNLYARSTIEQLVQSYINHLNTIADSVQMEEKILSLQSV